MTFAAERVNTQHGPGIRVATPHFLVWLIGGVESRLEGLPYFLEDALKHCYALTGLSPTKCEAPYEVFMFASRKPWLDFLAKECPDFAPNEKLAGLCSHGTCILHGESPRVWHTTAHEAMHQLLDWELQPHLPPQWLTEGLAMAAEGHDALDGRPRFDVACNPCRFAGLAFTVRGRALPSLLSLLEFRDGNISGDRDVHHHFHALWALQRFILATPSYAAGQRRLLHDLAAGVIEPAITAARWLELQAELFRRYISDDLPGFEAEYKRFAEALVQPLLAGAGEPQTVSG